jgi:hypothetical protein
MRDLHNVVTENDCAMAPVSRHSSYCRLIDWCDRAGVPAEYVEHLLWLRPLTSEEVAEYEAEEKRMHEGAREAEALPQIIGSVGKQPGPRLKRRI